MTVNTYIPLFKVNISNAYYKGTTVEPLRYTPSSDTTMLLSKFSMRYQNISGGLIFYIATQEPLIQFLKYVERVTDMPSFSFTGTAVNPDFYQFTDLPINQTGTVYFDTENEENQPTHDGLSLKGVFKPMPTATNVFDLKVQFKTLLAYLEKNTVPNFQIDFKTRKTQWNYYIINNSGIDYNNLSIAGTSDFQFDAPKMVTIPNGQEATLLSSGTTKIPLSAVPAYQLNLINTSIKNGTLRRTIVFKGLPNPNPATIEIYTENGEYQVASLMYVYI